MKARPIFWLFLILTLFFTSMAPTLGRLQAQNANQTVPINAPAGTTQILGSGGAFPSNPYGINTLVLWNSSSLSVQATLVTGTQNGNACAGTQTALTGLIPVAIGTTGGLIEIVGSPAIVVSGSSALCLVTTGGAATGFMTFNR